MGTLLNIGQIAKFQEVHLKFNEQEAEMLSYLLARFGYMINESIDEEEAQEIIFKHLKKKPLGVEGIHELGYMVRSTAFDPDKHTVH